VTQDINEIDYMHHIYDRQARTPVCFETNVT
jgi:hypothetical protein